MIPFEHSFVKSAATERAWSGRRRMRLVTALWRCCLSGVRAYLLLFLFFGGGDPLLVGSP